MEALRSSEMWVNSYQYTRRNFPEVLNLSSKSVCEYVNCKNTSVNGSYDKRLLRIQTPTDNEVSKNSSRRDSEYDGCEGAISGSEILQYN